MPQPIHRQLLALYLARLDLIESHMENLDRLIVEAMAAHQHAIVRLAELPGLGIDSAQQIIAEIGPQSCRVSLRGSTGPLGWRLPKGVRRAPVYPVAIVQPKEPVPCVGSLTNSLMRCQEGGLSAPNCLPPAIFTFRVRKGCLGCRPSPLSTDLEGPSRRRLLRGILLGLPLRSHSSEDDSGS